MLIESAVFTVIKVTGLTPQNDFSSKMHSNKMCPFFLKNHRIIEWPGLDHPVSTSLLCAGSPTTTPDCPEPHPAWP